MSNHIALSRAEHREIRINTDHSVELGDAVMSCVTTPNEFRSVQNHYPILFQLNAERDEYRTVALFGFTQGENLFLQNGKWDARYRPLAIDIQPFLIGLPKEGQGDHQVHVDMDSPRVNLEHGTRVFDQDGNATEYLEKITQKLHALHNGYQSCPAFINYLNKYELIEPLVLEIELLDGSVNRLVGFHGINEEKLQALDGYALNELHQKNYLLPIFMILASMSNIVDLVERKNQLISND
ncbi:MAG: SapC family protein [Gammaproteobacteria bacterium]|nr:SapC family protein [Gammaproteobacteria bacterium]NNC97588.1 SapC family protein [Gammaproteobacteria bacterium]NNM14795.1 SapC family protein [Gammaproteobacteria bacterium]